MPLSTGVATQSPQLQGVRVRRLDVLQPNPAHGGAQFTVLIKACCSIEGHDFEDSELNRTAE